jgi:hypothetical protein
MTNSSWVRLYFWAFSFYSIYGISGRHNIFPQILHLMLWNGFMELDCWLHFLYKMFTSISILVSGLCMVYHNFNFIFSCNLHFITPGLGLQAVQGLEYLHRSPASCKRWRKGNPLPGGYKCGNLALQVGGVSDETVKYGYGFCKTRRPVLSSERAPHKNKTATLKMEAANSFKTKCLPLVCDMKFRLSYASSMYTGLKSHKGARHQDILTDCQS